MASAPIGPLQTHEEHRATPGSTEPPAIVGMWWARAGNISSAPIRAAFGELRR
jgi:hypothetical protein